MKISAKQRWFLVYTLIGLATPFCILYPLANKLRFLGKLNPLWFVLDDTIKNKDGTLAEDYRIFIRDYKKVWVGDWMWHINRNRVWNLVEMFKVPNGNPEVGNQKIVVTKLISDELVDGTGRKMKQDGPWAIGAGLKYVGQPGDDPYQVNRGDKISQTHSIFGEGEIEYKIGDWEGWRYTSCLLVRAWWTLGIKEMWRTQYFGTNANRYAFKWKYQSQKPIVTWEP